ncbi:FAD:protein FMN transferase [Maliponia aquimaris]|uniref:FAD:protein FMN transferase n=1 Tax=Maliponia aquimaris TaxID=1673631 RepID=A0A238KK23_9RHOB|nr:FAD:protein FMN transferase [Maliponia aquimaris]SMX42386.1 Thiamine biosynthesis lipoprotein ApbE precursor [Maliponia aquimaris]
MTHPLKRRDFLLAGGAAALLTGLALRPSAPALARGAAATEVLTGPAFGTTWTVRLPTGKAAPVPRIETLLAGIDAQMSPWRTDSRITALNRAKAGRHPLSPELALVTGAALHLAEMTGGAFDPTVGPAVARWGFGPIAKGAQGWHGLSVDGESLHKAEAPLTLDLCGIAKGRALDLMATALLEAGQTDFLTELGGELIARGAHPSGRAWRVGVEDPRPGTEGLAGSIKLDRAVATSGIKANGYSLGDRRYCHIIDPATQTPVPGTPASVSVLASDAMTADGWATALMAAGPDGPALARAQGIDALFLFDDAPGLRAVTTGAVDYRPA